MTTLSPRLAHLLIHEDQSTGRLIMPDGRDVREPRLPSAINLSGPNASSSLFPSPPVSPQVFAHEASPTDSSSALPTILPPPTTGRGERRPSASIFSLLNEARAVSPQSPRSPSGGATLRPSTASSASLRNVSSSTIGSGGSSPSSSHSHLRIQPPPHTYNYGHPPPRTAAGHPASYDGRGEYMQRYHHRSSAITLPPALAQRPEMARRHSSQPYEFSPASRPAPYLVPAQPMPGSSYTSLSPNHLPSVHQHDEYAPLMGSRAPISRTTKACNACRSRKVRCDAGGLPNGEPGTCSRCKEAGMSCVYSGPQKKRGPCPGYVCHLNLVSKTRADVRTVRQPSGARSRRPSHRSSVTSIATSHVTTPPTDDEQHLWSARSSYGFPPPGSHASQKGATASPTIAHRNPSGSVPVLSWPAMSPAIEVDADSRPVFRENYTMRPKSGAGGPPGERSSGFGGGLPSPLGMSLPPLRVAIERRDSYFSP